ncbi:hypothetical protein Droror1_Dr00010627 [Drosera rotundifolia]
MSEQPSETKTTKTRSMKIEEKTIKKAARTAEDDKDKEGSKSSALTNPSLSCYGFLGVIRERAELVIRSGHSSWYQAAAELEFNLSLDLKRICAAGGERIVLTEAKCDDVVV